MNKRNGFDKYFDPKNQKELNYHHLMKGLILFGILGLGLLLLVIFA